MQEYKYKYGDKPLKGYTIERAAGRGGFGEVYFAVSDSGRQVALKDIQNYEQIELRGIRQCMNLKSPHLVTIFDVKYNDKGKPFVIMEYVSGISLDALIKESPSGIGTQKASFFLREIAKGLSYLHENGIVHRDLKPGNIFYENGMVKIGDYGLTKAISASVHSAQTITVGTVHYMAPEIGAGCYDRSIDIYAMGAMLYEMLTGQPPYFGASPGEILMKHMTSEPDVKEIEEPFASVIKKAMAKDPKQRYQTVQEMVEDVFGTEHIRNSVSQFSPEDLSIIAHKVASKARIDGENQKQAAQKAQQVKANSLQNSIAKSVENLPDTAKKVFSNSVDPVKLGQRIFLAIITLGIISFSVGILYNDSTAAPPEAIALVFFMICSVIVGGILLARHKLLVNMENSSYKNFLTLMTGGVGAFIITFWLMEEAREARVIPQSLFPLICLLFFDLGKLSNPLRKMRISWEPAIKAGIVVGIVSLFFDGSFLLSGALAGAVLLCLQIISPWQSDAKADVGKAMAKGHRGPAGRHSIAEKIRIRIKNPQPHNAANKQTGFAGQGYKIIPPFVRVIWLILFLFSGAAAIGFFGVGELEAICWGLIFMALGFLCFIRVFRERFYGWFRYLIRPLIRLGFVAIFSFGIFFSVFEEEVAEGVACIIFGILGFLTTLIPISVFTGSKARTALNYPNATGASAPPQVPNVPAAAAQQSADNADQVTPPPLPQPSSAVNSYSGTAILNNSAYRQNSASNVVLAFLGYLFYIVGIITAFSAIIIPNILACMPELFWELYDELNQDLGGNFLDLYGYISIVSVVIVFILSALFLILSRRNSYAFHLLRAGIGTAGLALCVVWTLSEGVVRFYPENRVIQNSNFGPILILTMIQFLISATLVFWPAKQKQINNTKYFNSGVN